MNGTDNDTKIRKKIEKICAIHVYPNWTKEQNHMGNHLVPSKKMARTGNKRQRIEREREKVEIITRIMNAAIHIKRHAFPQRGFASIQAT